MKFQMHHKTVLPYPYEAVYHVLSSGTELERLQRLAPFVQTFTLLPSDFVAPITSDLDPNSPAFPRPIDLQPTSNAHGQERTNFTFTGSALFQTVTVRGSQVALPHLGAVLFESEVKSSGIRELKLRVCTSIEGGKKVEVEETVYGTAPALLAKFLTWTGLAAKTHRDHMQNYHKLFTPGDKLTSRKAKQISTDSEG